MDKSKLAKLLQMTTSDIEGEALTAMRMANKMVKDADLTWDQVLNDMRGHVSIQVFDFTMKPGQGNPFDTGDAPDPHRNANVINQMFAMVYSVPADGSEFWTWLDSVKNQWDQNGRLTKTQYDGLRRSYARVMRSRGAQK